MTQPDEPTDPMAETPPAPAATQEAASEAAPIQEKAAEAPPEAAADEPKAE